MMETKDPIEKLRDYAAECCPEYEQYDSYMMCLADEIEAQYMKLPVDADGVPVSIDDKLTRYKTNGKVYEVEELRYDGETWWFESGEGCFSCDSASHVKPDTVESLLEDMVKDIASEHVIYVQDDKKARFGARLRDIRDDYAERIRKAVENEQAH